MFILYFLFIFITSYDSSNYLLNIYILFDDHDNY